jgi:hypothetical protein
MEAAGVAMNDFTLEEFEIDQLHLGTRERSTVS